MTQGMDSADTPPPLMPRSTPARTSSSFLEGEDMFPESMEMDASAPGSVVAAAGSGDAGSGDATGRSESPAMPVGNIGGDLEEAEKPVPTVASPDLSGVSSLSQGESDSPANHNSQELGTKEEEREESDKPMTLGRRHSYELATEEGELDTFDTEDPKTGASAVDHHRPAVDHHRPKKTMLTHLKEKTKSESDAIKRSTSSVEACSPAAIKLRTNLTMKTPRSVSSISGGFYPSSLEHTSVKDPSFSSLKSFSSPQSTLDHLIDKEINTGSYMAPLIGCIPPSALKCFADKAGAEKPSPMTSPSHSQSGE